MEQRERVPNGRNPNITACAVLESADTVSAWETPEASPRPRGARHQADGQVWAVVLAGGEGRRIQPFTTLRDGVVLPKQFCRFRDDRTLLAATVDRASRIASRERVLAVVLEAHREWWAPELAGLPAANVLSQPANRGTAVAVIHALRHIAIRDRSPRIVFMPSDHDFENEEVMLRSTARAVRETERFPDDIVLLGVSPSHLDSEYGLIVPAPGPAGGCRPVREFVEKPTLTRAAELVRTGAMWNSFIFASTGAALRAAFDQALPGLARSYSGDPRGGDDDMRTARFERLPECDFSRDVLQRAAGRLRLMAIPPCGWTDLGTPARLAAWLDRHREAPFWREHGVPRLPGLGGLPGALQPGGA